MVKKIDGPYEKLVFQLLDEDTFSRDDLLGSAEVKIEDIAQAGGSLTRVKSSTVSGEIDLYDADGKKIGYIDLSIEFEKDA